MANKIEISYKTIFFTIFFLVLLWFLVQVREIIYLVFIAFILMSAFKPWVDYLGKWHIPRLVSVISIYFMLIFLIIFAVTSIIPPLVSQTVRLGESLPGYIGSFLPFVKIDQQIVSQQIAPFGENLVKLTIGIFSNVFTLFTIFMVSFYLLIERKHLEHQLSGLIGEQTAKVVVSIVIKVEERLGAWVRGQLFLVITIGLATYIGLTILGIPFALALAILAGLLEIVPIIGPIIAAIPAVLVAVTSSTFLALETIALYFVIQQVEANLVVPFVMKKTLGVSPLITIIALMVGAKLAGIGGALMAIPLFVMLETIITEYFKLKQIQ